MSALRQTLRRLGRTPAATALVVLTLAIGIGATSAIFSVVNGILIQPLPYPDSDRLIALRHRSPGDEDRAASTALYFTYREHNETFESLALWSSDTAAITGAGEPEEVRVVEVTHEFLPTLGVAPAFGRGFAEADDGFGAAPTVVLSHAYAQRRFGAAAAAVGRTLRVDGEPHAVIGVMPASFRFLREQADMLTPMQPRPGIGGTAFFGPTGERGIARLKPGVTLDEAAADVARMIPIARETFPPPGAGDADPGPIRFGPNLQPLKQNVVGDLDDVLWVLMGTIGALLAIACVNVANLQLVRTERRTQELAIRAALGAGRGALARGLLLEALLLALVGGAAGLALAVVGLPALVVAAAENLPSALDVTIDPTVVVFTLVVSLAAALLFGLAPIVRHARPGQAAALHAGARTHGPDRGARRTLGTLVVAQVALALVLLVAAGLMIRTFQALRDVDPGFAGADRVQTVTLSIPEASVPDFTRAIRMQNDIHERLSDVAGVESVGYSSMVPLAGDGPSGGGTLDGPGSPGAGFEFRFVSPGFFETLRTPLVAGRDFEWSDYYDETRPQVIAVSESLARRYWGTPEAALGERLRRSPFSPWVEIAGVVGDVHLEGVDRPAPDAAYFAQRDEFAQWMSRSVTFAVRSDRVGTPGFLDDLQTAIWSVDPGLPLASVDTLDALYRDSMARTSLTLVLLAIAGAMALTLGLVGLYAVVSYTLARRTREIGVRLALGARDVELERLLLGRALGLVVVGIAIGLGGAAALTGFMESMLFGVASLDPASYAAAAAALAACAALAAYAPVRRIARIDPTRALRDE